MPLTKRQFNLGVDDEGEAWMRQVYDLVAENRGLAYSSRELAEAVLGEIKSTARAEKFRHSVDVLVNIRVLEKRWVDDTDYYAQLQGFDTENWEPIESEFRV